MESACGGESPDDTVSEVLLAVNSEPITSFEGALERGSLVVEAGCVVLYGGASRAVIYWPPGTTLDGKEIVLPDGGTLRIDHPEAPVTLGGGFSPVTADFVASDQNLATCVARTATQDVFVASGFVGR